MQLISLQSLLLLALSSEAVARVHRFDTRHLPKHLVYRQNGTFPNNTDTVKTVVVSSAVTTICPSSTSGGPSGSSSVVSTSSSFSTTRPANSSVPVVTSSASSSSFSTFSIPTNRTSTASISSSTFSVPSNRTTTASISSSTFSVPSNRTTTASVSSSTGSSSTVSSSTVSSSSTTTSASATPSCYYWLDDVKHQGLASFKSDSATYKVYRNVKDYGAKGDGVTDDTAAINRAISEGVRCAPGSCSSTTTSPATVYFPPGTYIVSGAIIDYYYTNIIGNPKCMPTIKAKEGFSDRWVIDGNQYQPGGVLGFGATNLFWRQIRNFIIDLTAVDPSKELSGIHWPTAQATSLQNIVFNMVKTAGNKQDGLFIESGSGGFLGDLVFNGGYRGATFGNQQFTTRNLTFNENAVAIFQIWDWGWTYKGISINNCGVGIDMSSLNNGRIAVGSVTLIDSEIKNTPIGIYTARAASGNNPDAGGSLALENVKLTNVPAAVKNTANTVLLDGSTGAKTIAAWVSGNVYIPAGPNAFTGDVAANVRPSGLVAGGVFYERSKPQYANLRASDFLSARTAGAKGDGVTDDTTALNALFTKAAAESKVVFLDAGNYLVTRTVYIPAGSLVTGESYPVILSSGAFFNDINAPKPVVQIGVAGTSGNVELSDFIVSTKGAQAGAILIEYNLNSGSAAPSGIWDVHTRIGGFAGSDLLIANCPKQPATTITSSNLQTECIAAFMSFHITKLSSGLYLENVWLWVADHDVEAAKLDQITVYAGRGLLIESDSGNIWLYGTAVEHHVLYEYQLTQTQNVVLGQIQTETAYYQANPDARIPFPTNPVYSDPSFSQGGFGWGVRLVNSRDTLIYGAGLYSFFSNYDVSCSQETDAARCQSRIFSVENSDVSVYNLNTVGTTKQITVDGTDVADYTDNRNGFVQTIVLFRNAL